MTIEDIKNIIINEVRPNLNINGGTPWQTPSNKQLLKRLNLKYNNFFQNIAELLFLNNNIDKIDSLHIFCKMCGKKNKFAKHHYTKYCCIKCSAIDPELKKKRENTCFKHYGYRCNFSSPDKKLNGRATMKEKYGYERYSQIPGWQKECEERAKNRTKKQKLEIKLKAEKTYYKNYGYKHNWASKDPKLNGSATRKKLYGVNYMMQNPIYVEKAIETKRNTIDENGLDIIQKSTLKSIETNKRNHNGVHNWASKDPRLNGRATCKERYGNESFAKTDLYKNRYHNKDFVRQVAEKIYNTKKKNGSLRGSNPEDMIHQFLIYKFDFEDIYRWYKDKERYDFNCDFYIKYLDLFIEINFDPSHGKEPFDKNNKKHLEILEKWKKRAQEINFKKNIKSRYLNFIYVWTDLDPRKLQTFKQNNLNYKIFYNLDEFLDWFETI